jgi:mono/diheme cytochrome c family protein
MQKRLIIFFLSSTLLACGRLPVGTAKVSTEGSSVSLGSSPELEKNVVNLLSTKCGSCHDKNSSGGVSQITNVSHLLSSGLVRTGLADQSPLFLAISQQRMPPAGPMSGAEIAMIKAWINQDGSAVIVPVPDYAGPYPATPVTGTLAQRAQQVFAARWLSCHGANAQDGPKNITDVTALAKSSWIKAGRPLESAIYTEVSTQAMPTDRPLNTSDVITISAWIESL